MPNYRLTLTFEGTGYHGWQVQPNAVTVQEVVAGAIERTVGQKVNLLGCGRTDTGVHAENYVASFQAESDIAPERMRSALNSRLPEDIVVTACDIAPDDFHATRSATGKLYRYTIATGPVPPVFERRTVYWVPQPLDVDAMQAAARHLVGEHDFASFVTEHDPAKDTVRRIRRLDVERGERTITITVEGNGFLYNMVRTIAGCLIAVGRGSRTPDWLREVLAARDRRRAVDTAPAQGLCLVKPFYGPGTVKNGDILDF